MAFPSSTHLITLPIPSPEQPTTLVTHTTHFSNEGASSSAASTGQASTSSLYVWCGESNTRAPSQANDDALHAPPPPPPVSAPVTSLLEEAHYAAPVQKPREAEAGQDLSTLEMPPTGFLTREWAVAMTRGQGGSSARAAQRPAVMTTSLFHSNSDMAKPMAARLAKRFGISQLFLCLSLPEELLATIEGPFAGPEGSKALLVLEGALGQVIKEETLK